MPPALRLLALPVAALALAAASAPAAASGSACPADGGGRCHPATGAPADPAVGRVVVRFTGTATAAVRARLAARAGAAPTREGAGGDVVLRARPPRTAAGVAGALAADRHVAWAAPALSARIAGAAPVTGAAAVPFLDDTGEASREGTPGGWSARQWDLTGAFGIRAPQAWARARRTRSPGGRGVLVAVLDTGVAYADRGPFRRSPDLPAARMVRGRDFVDGDDFSNDEDGHGTIVASIIAAAAGNHYGMVGVAYAADVLAVRVLDRTGRGASFRVAQGIRYAVDRGARVINVSIELTDQAGAPAPLTYAPDIRGALRYARAHRVTVVAAAGNAGDEAVPGRAFDWLSIQVGGTTERGCAATYSNSGPGLDLVAPGGGADSRLLPDDLDCRPDALPGRAIRAVTFAPGHPDRFLVPPDTVGTSMAAPHVTGVVALMLAAGTLGPRPTPARVAERLAATALDLGYRGRDRAYGAGLLDAAAALGAPRAVSSSAR